MGFNFGCLCLSAEKPLSDESNGGKYDIRQQPISDPPRSSPTH